MGLRPDYVGEMLGGMLLTGIGVGLTLPTLMATGTPQLPTARVRDRLGGHQHAAPDRARDRRRRADRRARYAPLAGTGARPPTSAASWVIAAIALAGGIVGLVLLAVRPRPAAATLEPATLVAAAERS